MDFFGENSEHFLKGYSSINDREYFMATFETLSSKTGKNLKLSNASLLFLDKDQVKIFEEFQLDKKLKNSRTCESSFIFTNNDDQEEINYLGYSNHLNLNNNIHWILSKRNKGQDIIALTPMISFYYFKPISKMKAQYLILTRRETVPTYYDINIKDIDKKYKLNCSLDDSTKLEEKNENSSDPPDRTPVINMTHFEKGNKFEVNSFDWNFQGESFTYDNCVNIFKDKSEKNNHHERKLMNHYENSIQKKNKKLLFEKCNLTSTANKIHYGCNNIKNDNGDYCGHKTLSKVGLERNVKHKDISYLETGTKTLSLKLGNIFKNEIKSSYQTNICTSRRPLSPTKQNVIYVLRELPPLTSSEFLNAFGISTKNQTTEQKLMYMSLVPLIKTHAKLLETSSGRRVFHEKENLIE
jgi:hypothetical protein